MTAKPAPTIAYSYLRYSSPEQGDGDSIRRQTAAASAWCQRNNATLDTSTTYADKGRSGYHGKHRAAGGYLRRFLDDVQGERIPRGSVLLIENMDRLSREKPVVGVNLLTGLLLAGIRVVQLMPDEIELTEDSDLFSLFRGQMSQARGHDESKTKANRISSVWSEKKRKAREEGAIVTKRLPAWVQERAGKLVPIPERAALVRKMFQWATAGFGLSLIVKRLATEQVEGWGRSKVWSKAYVYKILSGRSVVGEYQPIGHGKEDGTPIANYYPPVVDLATWERAQQCLAARRDRTGRVGKKVANLFTGLVTEARTGKRLLIAWQTRGSGKNKRRARVLVSADSMEGRAASVSFPNDVFEECVLAKLREVKVSDVTGEKPESETATLAAEIKDVERRMSEVEAEMVGDGCDVPALARVLKALDAKRQELLRRHALARQNDANAIGEAWREAETLLDIARDEAKRLRLRGLLQAAVESIRVLIVPGKSHRFAAVQVRFRGVTVRSYLILYRPARRGREGDHHALSFAEAGVDSELDLRRPDHVSRLGKILAAIDVAKLAEEKPKRGSRTRK